MREIGGRREERGGIKLGCLVRGKDGGNNFKNNGTHYTISHLFPPISLPLSLSLQPNISNYHFISHLFPLTFIFFIHLSSLPNKAFMKLCVRSFVPDDQYLQPLGLFHLCVVAVKISTAKNKFISEYSTMNKKQKCVDKMKVIQHSTNL